MRLKATFILLATAVLSMTAQNHTVTRHIDTDNRLSSNFVLGIAFDSQGFAWIATESKLNRIAGNTCTVFQKADNPAQSKTGITSNTIRTLFFDKGTDQMLIGTDNGLSIYNNSEGCFRNFTCDEGLKHPEVTGIVGAGDGQVWLLMGNGMVQQMDCHSYALTDAKFGRLPNIRCGMYDGKGHLYVGHKKDGMTIVNLKDNSKKHYAEQPGVEGAIPGGNVRSIRMDSRGHLWVGTNHGLAFFNPAKGTFTKVSRRGQAFDDNVFNICETADTLLWVANDMGGIRIVDLKRTPLEMTDEDIKTSSLNIRGIAQDEFGNVWIGNHSTGIDFIPDHKSAFNTIDLHDEEHHLKRIYGITRDANDHIWLGGEDELTRYDATGAMKTWKVTGRLTHTNSYIMAILADSRGVVWLGMEDEGVVRFNTATEHFEALDMGKPGIDIRALCEDSEGNVWIGAEDGLYCYADGKLSRPFDKFIADASVGSICQSRDGRLIVATISNGIHIIDLKTHTEQTLTSKNGLQAHYVNHVFADRKLGLWIATDLGLVHIPDLNKPNQMEILDDGNGLMDKHVRAIQQDQQGNIWVSTYSGLACWDVGKQRFYNYSAIINLPSGSYVAGSAASTSDGTIYFGSPKGVCQFNPQQLNTHEALSDAQIVFCQAYNPAGEDTEILTLVPDERGRVYTTYRQNTIHMAFTVKDFAQAGFVEYSYMMKGLNDKWYYIDNDHDVVFRGLSPGKYTFILRVKLKDQDWDEAATTSLVIDIAPPFWQTWWAYALYLLIIGGSAWLLLRNYKHRLELRNSLELEKQQSAQTQQLNEERMHFFTNITHELLTPLDLIIGPSERLVEDKLLPDNTRKKVMTIYSNALRLRNLINDLLEFRKTESNNRRLCVESGNIGALIKEIGKNYKEMNRNDKVSMHLIVHPALPQIFFDAEVITTILSNILSNAFKYTEQGYINIIATADNLGMVNISVTDTGCGIAPDVLPHIFESYYQGRSKQTSGTGIGLALVKSLADLHEAKLSVESTVGKGSKFTFSLRIDNTYPDAEKKNERMKKMKKMKKMKE